VTVYKKNVTAQIEQVQDKQMYMCETLLINFDLLAIKLVVLAYASIWSEMIGLTSVFLLHYVSKMTIQRRTHNLELYTLYIYS
jgi:hypothetical protein